MKKTAMMIEPADMRSGDLLLNCDNAMFMVLQHDVAAQVIEWTFLHSATSNRFWHYRNDAEYNLNNQYRLVARGSDDATRN